MKSGLNMAVDGSGDFHGRVPGARRAVAKAGISNRSVYWYTVAQGKFMPL
jgi:hypothetical protein